MPTRSTRSSNQAGSGFTPAIVSGSRMFSRALSIGSKLKNWKMNPMCSLRSLVSGVSARVVISVPATCTEPDVGLSKPARMCMSVDLPDPDGPITAVIRPTGMSTLTPRSAATAVSPSPKTRERSAATTTVALSPLTIGPPSGCVAGPRSLRPGGVSHDNGPKVGQNSGGRQDTTGARAGGPARAEQPTAERQRGKHAEQTGDQEDLPRAGDRRQSAAENERPDHGR